MRKVEIEAIRKEGLLRSAFLLRSSGKKISGRVRRKNQKNSWYLIPPIRIERSSKRMLQEVCFSRRIIR
jgi:hypothetical protein